MPFNNLTNAVIKYKTKGKVEGKKKDTPPHRQNAF